MEETALSPRKPPSRALSESAVTPSRSRSPPSRSRSPPPRSNSARSVSSSRDSFNDDRLDLKGGTALVALGHPRQLDLKFKRGQTSNHLPIEGPTLVPLPLLSVGDEAPVSVACGDAHAIIPHVGGPRLRGGSGPACDVTSTSLGPKRRAGGDRAGGLAAALARRAAGAARPRGDRAGPRGRQAGAGAAGVLGGRVRRRARARARERRIPLGVGRRRMGAARRRRRASRRAGAARGGGAPRRARRARCGGGATARRAVDRRALRVGAANHHQLGIPRRRREATAAQRTAVRSWTSASSTRRRARR